MKYSDVTDTINVDTTGAIILLNGLTRGNDSDNRIANRIRMLGAEFKGYVDTAANAAPQTGRILIVYDLQSNGTTPTMTDFLQLSASISPMNRDNLNRFIVLHDLMYTVQEHGVEYRQPHFSFVVEIQRNCLYGLGNAGTVADIVSGALYIVSIGSIANGADTGSLTFYNRLYYYDY